MLAARFGRRWRSRKTPRRLGHHGTVVDVVDGVGGGWLLSRCGGRWPPDASVLLAQAQVFLCCCLGSWWREVGFWRPICQNKDGCVGAASHPSRCATCQKMMCVIVEFIQRRDSRVEFRPIFGSVSWPRGKDKHTRTVGSGCSPDTDTLLRPVDRVYKIVCGCTFPRDKSQHRRLN